MPSASARVVFAALLVTTMTAATLSGFAQGQGDVRNDGEFYRAVGGVNCWDCHAGTRYHYEPALFYVETKYSEIPIGETVPIELVVRHIMTIDRPPGLLKMRHAMQNMVITVDTSGAPGIVVVTDELAKDVEDDESFSLGASASHERVLEVHPDAFEMRVRAVATDAPPTFGLAGDGLHLEVVSPTRERFDGQGPPGDRTVHLDEAALDAAGSGAYNVKVTHTHPFRPASEPVSVRLEWSILHHQEQTSFRFDVPGGDIRGGDPQHEQWRRVTVPIQARTDEVGLIDFRLEVENYWPHLPADQATGDLGLFYRFDTLTVRGGDRLVTSGFGSVQAPVPPGSVEWQHLFTRILGFTSMVLVPLAMITGGVFGKGSRRWLNHITGGAKKRVLWHNTVSLFIIGVACVHFVLALIDGRSAWTRGLLWGGIGWALLVSLGFTGYYQVRMIRRWDYTVWRRVHLSSAIAVFAFGLVHMVLDGGDLGVVREALPGWTDRLVWPR